MLHTIAIAESTCAGLSVPHVDVADIGVRQDLRELGDRIGRPWWRCGGVRQRFHRHAEREEAQQVTSRYRARPGIRWLAGFRAGRGGPRSGRQIGAAEQGARRAFVPAVGARVRFLSPQLGPGWRVGMFNQTRQVPPCYHVLVFDPWAVRRLMLTVPVTATTRVKLSELYPGNPADPDPGAAAHIGETWSRVPPDSNAETGQRRPDSVREPLQNRACN